MKKSALFLAIASASFALAGCEGKAPEAADAESEVAVDVPAAPAEVVTVPADEAAAGDAAETPVTAPSEGATTASAETSETM